MNRKFFLVTSVVLGTLVLLTVAINVYFWAPERTSDKLQFTMPTGGDFTIPSTQGTFSTADERGRVLFLFFGFTNCPHICPTTLMNLRTMLKGLPENLQDKVKVLFVSIDPERDTPEVLKKRIDAYATKNIVGATDSDLNLLKITKLFGARYSRFKAKDGTPLVDHTSQVFVINERGEWVDRLEFDVDPEEYRHAFETANEKRPVIERLHPLKDLSEIGRNETCDVALGPCEIAVEQGKITLSMSPNPVRQGQRINVVAKTSSTTLTPVLLDMVGIDVDMGYLRPQLGAKSPDEYTASFDIPICEVRSMRWKARLIVQDSQGSLSAITYYLKTEM